MLQKSHDLNSFFPISVQTGSASYCSGMQIKLSIDKKIKKLKPPVARKGSLENSSGVSQ